MTTYFTADTYFRDVHSLRQRADTFGSVAEQDEALIARWNEMVSEADDVWHLGDFARDASRERCAEIFDHLRGNKRLIRGNDDTKRVLELPLVDPPAESIRMTIREEDCETRLYLARYARRAWPGLRRGTRHLYGHTHGSRPDTQRSCDVGVDASGYRPVQITAIIARQDLVVEI